MPQRPSASPAASAGTSPPSAHTTPSPVITTRRGTRLLPRPLREDEVDERVHRAEGASPDLLVGDRDVEAVLDQHHQLERVDRAGGAGRGPLPRLEDRKSTRLNSSH